MCAVRVEVYIIERESIAVAHMAVTQLCEKKHIHITNGTRCYTNLVALWGWWVEMCSSDYTMAFQTATVFTTTTFQRVVLLVYTVPLSLTMSFDACDEHLVQSNDKEFFFLSQLT